MRLGKVLQDVDAGLITANTELSAVPAHADAEEAAAAAAKAAAGDSPLTGPLYLETVLLIDKYAHPPRSLYLFYLSSHSIIHSS